MTGQRDDEVKGRKGRAATYHGLHIDLAVLGLGLEPRFDLVSRETGFLGGALDLLDQVVHVGRCSYGSVLLLIYLPIQHSTAHCGPPKFRPPSHAQARRVSWPLYPVLIPVLC